MRTERNKKKTDEKWWYFIGAAGVILLYALFAYSLYTEVQVQRVKAAYKRICEMNMSAMDEEDEELLQEYQVSKLEFLIVDEEYEPVYVTKSWETERQIQLYITKRLEKYQEAPTITVRKNWKLRIIHLRAAVTQDGKKYYVHIRREMHAVGEMVLYSSVYFGLAVFLFWMTAYIRNRKKREEERTGDLSGDERSRLNRAEKEFVANVSHELKTPLAVISGQVELLQKMGDEIDREYYFASIREEIEKMSEMVGNLLDITIMEHRMEEMEMSKVNLTDMMNYLILKYDALFQKNKIKIVTEVAPDCIVTGNHMYLEQAVNNYIMNAFQHTAQGNKMAVRLSVENHKEACISVYNEGAGIAPAERERIWQSFYMKSRDGQREQRISNAGLGLYMVKKIVEQHHGTCGVENKTDGVEFWIRLSLDGSRK